MNKYSISHYHMPGCGCMRRLTAAFVICCTSSNLRAV